MNDTPTDATRRRGRRSRGPLRVPGALWVAAVLWSAFALLDLVVAVQAFGARRLEPEARRVAGQLGRDFVGGAPAVSASAVLALLAGIVTASLVLVLLTGRGWARWGLVVSGVFASLVLAWDGRFAAFLAFGLLIAGAAALATPAAHRFLTPASTAGA